MLLQIVRTAIATLTTRTAKERSEATATSLLQHRTAAAHALRGETHRRSAVNTETRMGPTGARINRQVDVTISSQQMSIAARRVPGEKYQEHLQVNLEILISESLCSGVDE